METVDVLSSPASDYCFGAVMDSVNLSGSDDFGNPEHAQQAKNVLNAGRLYFRQSRQIRPMFTRVDTHKGTVSWTIDPAALELLRRAASSG
ncbi:MAG: hypothetical protein ACSHXK_05545 [Oceanococcus sp.]